MTLEQVQAHLDAATSAANQQLELSKTSLTNQLDAGDRIIMRKAAETAMQLAQRPDPQ